MSYRCTRDINKCEHLDQYMTSQRTYEENPWTNGKRLNTQLVTGFEDTSTAEGLDRS